MLPPSRAALDIDENKYRDNGLLKYWFRGIEKYAPWVRRIHFITMGQKPAWLDENHPKLHLVNHTDYIPREFLPTFNSNVIELMIHKIPDLAEHFVHFNDDFFSYKSRSAVRFFFKRRESKRQRNSATCSNLKIWKDTYEQ